MGNLHIICRRDLVFNGCIRTLDDQNTVAQAVGIENGKITFIGTDQEAERIFCEDRTDLQGRLLLPGFVDTHLHMLHYAFVEKSVKLFDCRSVEEMLNAAGRLFGGQLMQWLDEVAGLVAKRHIKGNVITASVDNLRFIHGAYQGEMVVIIGKATYVANSSMEVRVDTYVEHMENGMRYPINRAYFTMVGLDENDKPMRIPRLKIEGEEQKAEWQAAEKRREMRVQRRKEGF